MSDNPNEVHLALDEFDRDQLPESQRALQGDAFQQAVQDHLTAEFIDGMGAAQVVITDNRIIIRWKDTEEGKSVTDWGVDYLKEGNFEKGIATLRVALQRTGRNAARAQQQ